MNSKRQSPFLAFLVVAAFLFASLPHANAAQRRRRRARTTHTQTRPTQAAPQATPAQIPAQTPARAETQPVTVATTQHRAEPDRPIEELLSADAYGVYVELRHLGTIAQAEEIGTAAGMLQLIGGSDTKPLADLYGFIKENAEELADARVVLTYMPTRVELPDGLLAVELSSDESAAAFEPKYRRFVDEQIKEFMPVEPKSAPARTRAGRRLPAREKQEQDSPNAISITFKRVGRWLISSNSKFTLKSLRGDEGASALTENVRFQSARTRFSSDTLFVYVDTTLAQQGWAVERQKAEARAAAAEAQAGQRPRGELSGGGEVGVIYGKTKKAETAPVVASRPVEVEPAESQNAEAAAPPPPTETPTPEGELKQDVGIVARAEDGVVAKDVVVTKPSDEQAAAWRMNALLGSIWQGIPRIPGTVALGVGLEAGVLKARLAVENTPDGTINVIPFLPNIVAGAPVAGEAASIAPEDSDIFFTTSVDWTQIYTSSMGTAAMNPSSIANVHYDIEGDGETASTREAEKPPTADETIASIEKLFGFKFKEDLLPALGNEVSFSMPFDLFTRRFSVANSGEKPEEKDSVPGFAVIISLNNPGKIGEILPRVLVALNVVSPGATFAPVESREGFEIHRAGDFAYTIINNFLVASEDVRSVRHVVDSFAARRTLSSSSSFRDTTAWQARQKLVGAYVSEALMREIADASKRSSGASDDPVVRALIAQLDAPPESASFESTNEGDVLLHELHVPVSMIKSYAASLMIAVKDSRVTSNESMAAFALNRIMYAEEAFKNEKKKERYGTLEELVAEELLEKDFLQRLEYKIELNATSEKYEATATPKSYGKTGRRSFFIDETGQTRAADHKGRPASVDDPPIE